MKKAIVTVMGVDKKGIIAGVSTMLSDFNINILDINQTIMQNIFTMVMLVDIREANKEFKAVSEAFDELGKKLGVEIRIQHEDIFNSMHKI